MYQLSTLVFCFVDDIYHQTTAATGAKSVSKRHDGCHCEVRQLFNYHMGDSLCSCNVSSVTLDC